ncbi:cytochrome-c oxidase [Glaciecola punicea]|uniref:cbb3-type cytochrome oxidase subunit 3 n=1 Tax=Glaciecola punicea TaxID=56804 RepID=UPI000871FE95|nr:cbb3-type cytochrome c oxidase subunit 3 [Glaciecola punicea]OFA33247.1 cytochrome-c oxidase [Glaciecola punicea]
MDQGIIGSIYTVIVFVAFIGAIWWAFNSRNKDKFDDAANIIFEEEKQEKQDNNQSSKKDQES